MKNAWREDSLRHTINIQEDSQFCDHLQEALLDDAHLVLGQMVTRGFGEHWASRSISGYGVKGMVCSGSTTAGAPAPCPKRARGKYGSGCRRLRAA